MAKKQINKVLLVRFSSIGDIVLTSPVIRCVHRQLGCEVHFVTKAKYRSVVEYDPHITKIYTIEQEITEILPELRSEQYDLIIDLHKNLRSKRLALSLGVRSLSFDKLNAQKWLRVHTRWNVLPQKHLVDRYFEALKAIGVVNDGRGLSYYHGLTEYDLSHHMPEGQYVAIALGATYYTKRIPRSKLEVVISSIKDPCVLLGGDDVSDLGAELAAKYAHVIDQCGKLSLNESAAIVLNSEYLVTGDTGLMHMAAGLKVPTMVFWGSTAYELGMYPYYGEQYPVRQVHVVNDKISCSPCSKIGKDTCPKGHFKCMLGLPEQAIIDAIRKMES